MDSYEHFVPLPERPEPTEAERAAAKKADRIGFRDLLKRLRWTAEDLETAQGRYAFPNCIGRTIPPAGGLPSEAYYSLKQIETWRERFREFAAKVK